MIALLFGVPVGAVGTMAAQRAFHNRFGAGFTTGLSRCFIQNKAKQEPKQKLRADVAAFATPIYYYEMSGQMKSLLDRMNCMCPKA